MIYFGIGCLENADLENADLANKDLENTDVSQTQKQPLLVSVMNLSPLVRLFFFFSRSAFSRSLFSRSVVCVFEVCVFKTPDLFQPLVCLFVTKFSLIWWLPQEPFFNVSFLGKLFFFYRKSLQTKNIITSDTWHLLCPP